jgi:predicted nuclease of predicted toxin-antitoxin system
MKILVDMNLAPAWVRFLAANGFEAVHWSGIGPGDAADGALMEWAVEYGHVILTADLDFGAILAATRHRLPSVIQLRSDLLTHEAVGEAVLTAIRQCRDELREGALLSIDLGRSRLRILPILT